MTCFHTQACRPVSASENTSNLLIMSRLWVVSSVTVIITLPHAERKASFKKYFALETRWPANLHPRITDRKWAAGAGCGSSRRWVRVGAGQLFAKEGLRGKVSLLSFAYACDGPGCWITLFLCFLNRFHWVNHVGNLVVVYKAYIQTSLS